MRQSMSIELSPEINDVGFGIAASNLRQEKVPMIFPD
jgi:hypothetical protein